MITIRKAVISRVWPDRLRAETPASGSGRAESPASGPGRDEDPAPGADRDEDPAVARLRDLAGRLAAYRDLQVSVITYEDGHAELQVLHAGPPHHTEDTIDRGKFGGPEHAAPGWVVSLADEGGVQDVTDLIRAALQEAGV